LLSAGVIAPIAEPDQYIQNGCLKKCSGSGRLTAGTSHADSVADNPGILDEGMYGSSVPASFKEADLTKAFSISSANVGLVRHIPRSARQRAAVVFESCFRDATRVGSLASWERVLRFAGRLCMPGKGGVVS